MISSIQTLPQRAVRIFAMKYNIQTLPGGATMIVTYEVLHINIGSRGGKDLRLCNSVYKHCLEGRQ